MKRLEGELLIEVLGKREFNSLPDPSHINSYNNSGSVALSPILCRILEEVQLQLGLSIDGSLESEELPKSSEIEVIIRKVCERFGFEITNIERDEILSYIERERNSFGILQSLVDDPQISDIIVTDFSNVYVQVGRKNYKTDIMFPSQEAYETFVAKLLHKASSSYSTKKPIADGMIGSFARVHVVHKSLCETGPYLTVRINRFSSVTVNDLINCGLAPTSILEYLTTLVQIGETVLVVGEVGTGKTTLTRALAASVPREESVLVIEDTPEIQLEHPNVRYIRTRESNTDGAGRVTPSECIRAGMRMAMNRIIFGEMRDAEAAEAFLDVCASGHPGLSTIHAKSSLDAIARLELFLGRAQRGASRSVFTEQIATAVQVIVHINLCQQTGKRRIMEVREIGPVADGIIRSREIFKYELNNCEPRWKVVNKVSAHKEKLEAHTTPFILSKLPQYVELDQSILVLEGAQTLRACG